MGPATTIRRALVLGIRALGMHAALITTLSGAAALPVVAQAETIAPRVRFRSSAQASTITK